MSKGPVKRKRRKRTKKDEEDTQRTQTSSRVKMTAEKLWWRRHLNKGCAKEKEQSEPAYSEYYLSSEFSLILIHSTAEEVERHGCTQKIIHLRSDQPFSFKHFRLELEYWVQMTVASKHCKLTPT